VSAPMTVSWLQEINDRPVVEVAAALGLDIVDSRHISPCPACNEEQRSKGDPRKGPIFLAHGGKGWKCQLCGVGGAGVNLAALVVFQSTLGKDDPRWKQLRALCAERGLCSPPPIPIDSPPPKLRPPRPVPEVPPPSRPEGVVDFWAACHRVTDDPQVSSWLSSRGLDPELVAERDLARALPHDPGASPRWATARALAWSEGWRLILPASGPTGSLETVRARWVGTGAPPHGIKSVSAAAGPGSASAAVYADGNGRGLLSTSTIPGWPKGRPLRVLVVEGEPDFLTYSTHWSDSASAPPAVLGVWSGSWSQGIADRIPSGTQVAIRTHADDAGERYAEHIARTLAGRCTLVRSSPKVPT
jgi:hypothetical protein